MINSESTRLKETNFRLSNMPVASLILRKLQSLKEKGVIQLFKRLNKSSE